MSLSVGIVGLPNAGKSTLFNALLGRQAAQVAEYPFTTIKPNTGVVEVPDERLEQLAALIKPQKLVPATIEFIDIAGLVKGAHQGEGLGNQFLGQIRACDAILHLIRDFSNPSVSRAEGSVDPASDLSIVDLEMVLADFEIVAKKSEEVKKKSRTDPKLKKLLGTLEKLKRTLGEGKFGSTADLDKDEKDLVKELNLLTSKPVVYVLNIDEKGPAKDKGLPNSYQALEICAELEAGLADLSQKEKKEFLAELGIKESGLDKLISQAYRLLGLITFYTIKGGQEVRAWAIQKGESALAAAAKVHTDMAKGFIKAEVIDVDKLLAFETWQKAKESGQIQLQGREYQVNDGDVVEFKFSL
jgi:GTP-binding protein YchF